MGIHDRVDPFRSVVHIADLEHSQVAAGNYTSDDASSVASEQPPSIRPSRRTRNSRAAALDYESLAERLHCRSKRYAKRHHHLSVVKTLVGLQESEIETEFSWTPDNYGRSIFSSLFAETDKMKAWNAFIELNEEDQMSVIENSESLDYEVKEGKLFFDPGTEPESDFRINDDRRTVHPSYSSAACFKLIDSNIKNVLKKRHLPLGFVENLELDVRNCIGSDPSLAVFEIRMETSFGRLLAHAVAQYLNLVSVSSVNSGGSTLVTLTSKNGLFNPPAELLCQYLEWKSGKHLPMQ